MTSLDTQPVLSASDTCAVVLTYGDRHQLLKAVVERVLSLGIGRVIVVFNGNVNAGRLQMHSNLELIELDRNLGSAGGYSVGIEAALSSQKPYVLLLDDDNLPADDCFKKLSEAHARLGNGEDVGLHAFRPTIYWHQVLLESGAQVIARANTYGWFHIANAPFLMLRQLGIRRGSPPEDASPHPEIRETSVACYGGLLLTRSSLLKAGLPDPRFFCYYDDFEFSDRIRAAGTKLYLCGAAVVNDIEKSWHGKSGRYHPAFSPETGSFRVFLDLRNAVFYCRKHIDNRLIYEINRLCFWAGIAYLAIGRSPGLKFSLARLRLILDAVRQGSRNEIADTYDLQHNLPL